VTVRGGPLVVVAALAVAALVPRALHAQTSTEAAAVALKKFEEGKAAYEAGQFEAAVLAFQASNDLQPSPNSLLYLGRCYRALGRVASAYTSFQLSAKTAQDRLVASGEKRYAATRDAATEEGAAIAARVPHLTVAVPSDVPADFALQLDGQPLARAAWGVAIDLDPGAHEAQASGHRLEPFDAKVQLAERDQRRIDVVVKRVPTAVLAIHLRSRPAGIEVQIDGAPVDPGQAEAPRELDVGTHTLTVSAPGYLSFTWKKVLADREDAEVTVTLAQQPGPPPPRTVPTTVVTSGGTPPWLFFTVGGAALVALGAGTYLGLDAQHRADAQTAMDPLLRDPAVQSSVRSESTFANVCFASSGVLALGAAILAFTTEWHPGKRTTIGMAPWLGSAAGGWFVRGEY
jgi:tetratricopeptide (TPR) repeat protein